MYTSSFQLVGGVTHTQNSSIFLLLLAQSELTTGATKGPVPPPPAYASSPFLLTAPSSLHLLFLGRSHLIPLPSQSPTPPPHAQTFGDTCWAQPSHRRPPPQALRADCVRWLLSAIFLGVPSSGRVFTSPLSPSFLEAISSGRVQMVLFPGARVVYLCEQGAVSPNKCTRGNGRKDLFDHILSKEIFDTGSSLPLILFPFLFFFFF